MMLYATGSYPFQEIECHKIRTMFILWVSLLLTFNLSLCSTQAQPTTATVQLVSVTQAEGLNAVFECDYPGSYSAFTWAINGSELLSSSLPDGVIGIGTPFLTIPALPVYNGSVIQCRVFPDNLRSPNATLTVLRISIHTVNRTTEQIGILWNSEEFTTNITYCVEINQTMLGSSELTVPLRLDSVCGLTGPEYTFPYSSHSVCDGNFSFTVTPTEGDMRGTPSEPVTGFLKQETDNPKEPVAVISEKHDQKEVRLDHIVPLCTNFTMAMVNSTTMEEPIQAGIDSESITFLFPTDTHAQVDVMLIHENAGIELHFKDKVFSTFDIQDLSGNNCSRPNTINVTLKYAINSKAPGAFIILIPVNNSGSMNVTQALYHIVSRTGNVTVDIVQISAPAGQYYLYAFDLENYNDTAGGDKVFRQQTSAASMMTVSNVSGKRTIPSYPTESAGVNISMLSDGVNVTYTGDKEHLILTHSHKMFEQIEVHPSGQIIPVTDFAFSIVVFTWSDSFVNADVSLVQQILPSMTSVSVSSTSPTPEVKDTPVIVGIILGVASGVFLIAILTVLIIISKICLYKCKHYSQDVPGQIVTKGEQDEVVFQRPTSISQEESTHDGEMYARLNLGASKNDCDPVDTGDVVYSQIDHTKSVDLAPVQVHNYDEVPPLAFPQEPTKESLAEILDPISLRWREIGEALGVSQSLLQTIDQENDYHKIKMHMLIQQYFGTIYPKPTWIEIARALRSVGEIEPANKIERTFNLPVPSVPTTQPAGDAGCEGCLDRTQSMNNPMGSCAVAEPCTDSHAAEQGGIPDGACL